MTMFVLSAGWLRKRVWFVGLMLTSEICGILGICEAQQAKGAKSTVQKDGGVRKSQPADIAELPPEFVEKLNARGCSIPQFGEVEHAAHAAGKTADDSGSEPAHDTAGKSVPAYRPSNVIRGEFARHGQEDWAVLCSKGGSSTIVIFWGKTTACPASLARLDDAHYLKRGKDKKVRYSRSIGALGKSDLGDRAGIAGLKDFSHQGIDDRFVGKSSAFFYCSEGKWKIFPAKDSSSE